MLLLTASAVALWGTSPVFAATQKLEGEVLHCKYVLEADASGRSFEAKLSSCKAAIDPEATLEGSWQTQEGHPTTAVELKTLKLSVLGGSSESGC